jgi:hypothetical protein
MKRLILVVAVISLLGLGTGVARATTGPSDEYEDSLTHPLVLAYHLAYPAGFAAEWLIGRPLHYVFSRPYLDRFFGYTPHEDEGPGHAYRGAQ